MRKNKYIGYRELIKKIDSQLSELDSNESIEHAQLLRSVKEKIKLQRVDIIIYVFLSVFLLSLTIYYVYETNNQIDRFFGKQQEQIEVKQDSVDGLFDKIINNLNENILKGQSITYRVDDEGNLITYHELARENDSLINKNIELELKSKSDSISIENITLDKNRNDKYVPMYYDLLHKHEVLEWQFDYVKEKYNIIVNVRKYKENGKNWIEIKTNSPEIDSALIFYKKYKDNERLNFNTKKEHD